MKKIGLALLTASMAIGATAAHAQTFTTLGAIPAQAMSADQLKQVEGKAHVFLKLTEMGVVLPNQQAIDATRAAAPTPQNNGAGNSPSFRRSPSAEAPAFDAALGR